MTDEEFMRAAIEEAKKAAKRREAPIGAVIVKGGRIISRGHNRRETGHNAAAHAEVEAITRACRRLRGWRLSGCTMYVTLEPCPMCAGAIINSRLDRVVYGAPDPKAGCCGSVTNLFLLPFNHIPAVEGGCLKEECAGVLTDFFKRLREGKR